MSLERQKLVIMSILNILVGKPELEQQLKDKLQEINCRIKRGEQ